MECVRNNVLIKNLVLNLLSRGISKTSSFFVYPGRNDLSSFFQYFRHKFPKLYSKQQTKCLEQIFKSTEILATYYIKVGNIKIYQNVTQGKKKIQIRSKTNFFLNRVDSLTKLSAELDLSKLETKRMMILKIKCNAREIKYLNRNELIGKLLDFSSDEYYCTNLSQGRWRSLKEWIRNIFTSWKHMIYRELQISCNLNLELDIGYDIRFNLIPVKHAKELFESDTDKLIPKRIMNRYGISDILLECWIMMSSLVLTRKYYLLEIRDFMNMYISKDIEPGQILIMNILKWKNN